jgi:hypothetical protein
MPLTPSQFAAKHPPQAPRKPPEAEDQLRRLTKEDGVVFLAEASFLEHAPGRIGYGKGRHLWVIIPNALPVLLETAPNVRPPPLSSGVAKHTNLTGGAPACSGGELWTDAVDRDRLYVNGGSGRYGPRTPAELADAVHVFETFGFRVESAGWNEDNDIPERVFRKP